MHHKYLTNNMNQKVTAVVTECHPVSICNRIYLNGKTARQALTVLGVIRSEGKIVIVYVCCERCVCLLILYQTEK